MEDHSSFEDATVEKDAKGPRGSRVILAYASAVKGGSRIRTSCDSIYDTGKWHVEPDGFINEAQRAGGPHLCSLPARIDVLGNDHPQSHILEDCSLMRHILSTFARHDVYALSIKLRKCDPYEEDSFDDVHKTTLLIDAFRDGFDDSWLLACRQIWKYLSDAGHGQVNVEISDPIFRGPNSCAPIQKSDPLWSANEELKCRILRELDLTDMKWFTTVHVGMTQNRAKMQQAVIFMVSPESDKEDWRGTRDHIVDILDDLKLSMVGVIVAMDIDLEPVSSHYKPVWKNIGREKAALGLEMDA